MPSVARIPHSFKYMMLQKPIDVPTGFDVNKRCRASFFPKARLPAELLEQIELSLRFQRQMFIPDKVLHGRPMTTDNAKSRFTRPKRSFMSSERDGSPSFEQTSTNFVPNMNAKQAFSERIDIQSPQYRQYEPSEVHSNFEGAEKQVHEYTNRSEVENQKV